MYGHLFCLAATVLGIDVGWQRLPEGGLQYLIQIEPEMLETLKGGEPIESDIPTRVRDIRGYRITVGKGPLPKEEPPAEAPGAPGPSTAAAKVPADPFFGSRVAPFSQPAGPLAAAPAATEPAPVPGLAPMPRTLAPDPSVRPLAEQPAAFVQSSGEVTSGAGEKTAVEASPESSRPWWYFAFALAALGGSMTWNAYLLALLREARRRYRGLLDRTGRDEDEEPEEEE